jgi:protein-tyrosine-phosphatase
MYEGKPLLLVIGGSDTGRTPITAALLRKALGPDVIVQTAGVLSHKGESAAPEAQLALEQFGIGINRHIARPLDDAEHHTAELLLAVDRGTELVLFTRFRNDPRVACLSVLAEAPDVLDPHRMPLGVWISVTRQLQEQVLKALPTLRQRLGLREQESQPMEPFEEQRPAIEPPVLGFSPKMQWDNDEDMQRLMQLIDDEQTAGTAVTPEASTNGRADLSHDADSGEVDADEDERAIPAQAEAHAPTSTPETAPRTETISRAEHIARLAKMLEVAQDVPEIIDWIRLRQELVDRLRAVAQQPTGPTDFAPAATLMIEGKLMQSATLPSAQGLYLLHRSITRLSTSINAADLATIGGNLAEW